MTGGLAAYGNSMREGLRAHLSPRSMRRAASLGKQVEMVVADDQGTTTECVNASTALYPRASR